MRREVQASPDIKILSTAALFVQLIVFLWLAVACVWNTDNKSNVCRDVLLSWQHACITGTQVARTAEHRQTVPIARPAQIQFNLLIIFEDWWAIVITNRMTAHYG